MILTGLFSSHGYRKATNPFYRPDYLFIFLKEGVTAHSVNVERGVVVGFAQVLDCLKLIRKPLEEV